MRNVESFFELVLDHPATEPDRRLGHHQHRLVTEDVDVVFHLGGKGVGADPETAAQRQGVEGHSQVGRHLAPVDDRRQLTFDLGHQDVLVLNPVASVGQELGVDAGGDDVVVVALDVQEGLDELEQGGNIIGADLANHHRLAARQCHELRGIGHHGRGDGPKRLLEVNRHEGLPPNSGVTP